MDQSQIQEPSFLKSETTMTEYYEYEFSSSEFLKLETQDLKREDGSSAPFGNMPLDPGFPLFHGVIDCQTAMDR